MKTMFVEANTSDLSQIAWDVLISVRLEIFMFATAVVCYLLLFYSRVPKDVQRLKIKAKLSHDAPEAPAEQAEDINPKNLKSFDATHASLQRALEAGNHRIVLKCWTALKQFDDVPTVSLAQVVESFQSGKKDSQFIIRELKAYFKKNPSQCDMHRINDLLESLGKRLDSELMGMVVDMLPPLALKRDQRTYEIFLSMHATTRSFAEVQQLVSEMQAGGIEFSPPAKLAIIKAALQTGKFDEADRHFSELKASWDGNASSWPMPRHIMAQLVEVACKEHCLGQFVSKLSDVPLPEEALNAMLSECIRLNDSELGRSVETLARAQPNLADSTYSLLIKALEDRRFRMKALVQEVLNRELAEFSADLAIAVLNACGKLNEVGLADTLLERMKPKQSNVLSAFIRFYIDVQEFSKACDVFEHFVVPSGNGEKRRLMIDARVERSLMTAASSCGRSSLVQSLFDASKTDLAKHIVTIRKFASEKNLKGAKNIFDSLKKAGVELNSIVYNTVLDACVKCQDLKAAEEFMVQTKEAGMLDAVSFNTLMKAHLVTGNVDKARGVMEEMKKAGFQPNRVTFNELLNAMIAPGHRHGDVWELIKEMKDASVPPNQVTCSILLKSLNAKSSEADVTSTMDLIESIEEPMDEVMLSSVVEACVRIGKPDMLSNKLQQLQGKERIVVNGSHTCGSLIKAYGHAKDLEGVWRCWKEMRSKLIKPTSITLGCMIEAVVNNGDAEGAFDLIHEMQQDEQCRSAVNSIIYCSVLKGFSREKKLDRVWEVYEEMSSRNVEMSLITFNTIIDACARSGCMTYLPKVLQDMKKHHVEPNIVTYSTILKGHCQAGEIQLGFSTLKDMKRETNLKPDEIMYNSLLDGCAQNTLLDEGMDLFEEMQKEGITPSNFTLSIMVKLLNRCRKVEQAFDLVRDLPRKYNFKANAHVYTNLMQACISNRQHNRALAVLETMVKDRVKPDCRTYSILIRASLYQSNCEEAATLLRTALGLPGALDLDWRFAACSVIEASVVNETLSNLADYGHGQSLAAPLLADIKKNKVKVNVDQYTTRRLMSLVAGTTEESFPKGKGKGRGQKGSW